MKKLNLLLLLSLFVFLSGCSDDDESIKSNSKEILSFEVYSYSATINETQKQIELVVASNFNLEELEPVIGVSDKATISPASGVKQDFTKQVIYTVKAENGSEQKYTAIITKKKSSSARIEHFSINDVKGEIRDEWTTVTHSGSNSVKIWLKGVSDVTRLKPIIEVSPGAKVSPASNEEIDFSKPVVYTVTAEDGKIDSYTVGVQYSKYPSGLLYTTKIRNMNRTTDVTTHHDFDFDYLNRIKLFTRTTKPFYIGESLVDGDLVHIEYGSNGKISKLIMEEKVDNAVACTRTFNVSYPDNMTVSVSEQLAGNNSKQDIITLNDKGKVSTFEADGKKEVFVYDKYDNLVEQSTINGGHKKITYDDHNGLFGYFNGPHWLLLYTMQDLIGTGRNNPLQITTYDQNGRPGESIEIEYKYDTRTRYPQTFTYEAGGDKFSGIAFLSYVFPYSINLKAD